MKRAIAAVLLFVWGTAAGAFLRLAWAAPPTGCVYPAGYDNFQAVAPGQRLDAGMFNRMLCALNQLEQQALTGALGSQVRRACTPVSNVAAGDRVVVDVIIPGMNLGGGEVVLASVVDGGSPARLEVAEIASRLGSSVKVVIRNRDANAPRSGEVCVGAYL